MELKDKVVFFLCLPKIIFIIICFSMHLIKDTTPGFDWAPSEVQSRSCVGGSPEVSAPRP